MNGTTSAGDGELQQILDVHLVSTSNCRSDINFSLLIGHFISVYPVDQWKTEGFFTQDDLLDIDCHWMAFEPVRPAVHFSLAVLYLVFFLVGSFSNALVIYIISSTRKLQTPANILLTNLAFSDLLIILMVPIFIFNSFYQGPAVGKLGCTAYGFITGLAGTSAIMTLAAVALDRFLVISRPLKIDKKPTRCWAYVTCLLIWLYSAIFASLPFFGVGKYVPEGYLTSCSFDYLSTDWPNRIFILSFFFGAFVFPMIIITGCYAAIIRAVVHVRRNIKSDERVDTSKTRAAVGTEPSSSFYSNRLSKINSGGTADRSYYGHSGINQPHVEMVIAKIIFGLIATWTIAWTPYSLVSLAGVAGYANLITPFSSMAPALFAKSAACIDPFIYALNHPKIRQEIFYRLYRRFFSLPTASSSNPAGNRTRALAESIQFQQQNSDGNTATNVHWRQTMMMIRNNSRRCRSSIRRSAAQSSVLLQNDLGTPASHPNTITLLVPMSDQPKSQHQTSQASVSSAGYKSARPESSGDTTGIAVINVEESQELAMGHLSKLANSQEGLLFSHRLDLHLQMFQQTHKQEENDNRSKEGIALRHHRSACILTSFRDKSGDSMDEIEDPGSSKWMAGSVTLSSSF